VGVVLTAKRYSMASADSRHRRGGVRLHRGSAPTSAVSRRSSSPTAKPAGNTRLWRADPGGGDEA
jgi:hypothetical protein